MLDPGTVNDQITDSVTQVDTIVLGNAPAQTTGMLDAVMAESIGMAMYNAVTTQHNSQMVASAAVAAACARMLKGPVALPSMQPPLTSPVVSSSTPSPVPVNAESQNIQLNGSGFQPGVAVDVFDGSGAQIGTLAGSQQISKVSAGSFTMTTNLFGAAGSYGIEVVNPDGGRSSRYTITVTAFPAITGVVPGSANNSYVLSGSNFEPNFTVSVFDQAGNQMATPTISAITTATAANSASSFTMAITPGSGSTSPYSVQVLNPDGGESKLYSFDAGTQGPKHE